MEETDLRAHRTANLLRCFLISGEVKPLSDAPLFAMTSFTFAEACGRHVVEGLSKKDYKVIPFHANGIGDRAMDELIDQGLFDRVVDIVPAGVAEQLFAGNRASYPEKLEAVVRQGIPQVWAPSGFDMLSCGPLSRKDMRGPLEIWPTGSSLFPMNTGYRLGTAPMN